MFTTKQPIVEIAPGGVCKLLKSRVEVDLCSELLKRNGLVSHDCSAKNWDLANILGHVGHGDVIDLGSSDSYLLSNLARMKREGGRWGIDLRPPNVVIPGTGYLTGSLTKVPFPAGSMQYVTCLSVIEHGVDFEAFAKEASRLLCEGGLLFLTFDYWEPKVDARIQLYGLPWQPLNRAMTEDLIDKCSNAKLELVEDMNWTQGDAVINAQYLSPQPDVSYTFGMTTFRRVW